MSFVLGLIGMGVLFEEVGLFGMFVFEYDALLVLFDFLVGG